MARNAPLLEQFEHIAEHARFYKVMLGNKGVPSFAKRMKLTIEQAFYHKLAFLSQDGQSLPISRDILCRYVASAHFGVIEIWLESGLSYSPAFIANVLRQLVKLGPLNAVGILEPEIAAQNKRQD